MKNNRLYRTIEIEDYDGTTYELDLFEEGEGIVCDECGSLQEDDQLIEFITCVNCKATISL